MKTIKLALSIIAIAALTSSSFGQTFQKDVVVTINGLNYGEGIGTVYGNYTYHLVWQLNDDGVIERLHWNAKNFNLYNENGDKIQVIDSGLDTYGIIWDFFNMPNFYNGYIPEISYEVQDGWLEDIMPSEIPAVGTFINMSVKIHCKGSSLSFGAMVVVILNAHGDVVVNFAKP